VAAKECKQDVKNIDSQTTGNCGQGYWLGAAIWSWPMEAFWWENLQRSRRKTMGGGWWSLWPGKCRDGCSAVAAVTNVSVWDNAENP
jgi:hypothetical protein